MQEIDSNKEANNSLSDDMISCPNCVASKVAKSRLRELDKLRMQFVAVRPYRCLHCYHRFWQKERFTAEKSRVFTWLILALALLSLLALYFVRASEQGSRTPTQGRVKAIIDQEGTLGNEPSSAPESVIQPLLDQAVIDPQTHAEVSARLEEYGWYVDETDATKTSTASTETVSESTMTLSKSDQGIDQADTEVTIEEHESLLKVSIARYMKQWRNVWQNGDTDGYLAHYSDQFIPSNGQSVEQWRVTRSNRVTPQKKIVLLLSDFQVSFSEDHQTVFVDFDQNYRSETYSDVSRKRITWVKEDTLWKIVSEREIE